MKSWLASLSSDDVVTTCAIVRGEILFGLEKLALGRRRADLEAKAAKLFAAMPCEPVPAAAGDQYARVKATQQRIGLSLDENDLWIAATTLALGAMLVTRDRDFQAIDGLPLLDGQ